MADDNYRKTSVGPFILRKSAPTNNDGDRPTASDSDREAVSRLESIMSVLGGLEQSERASKYGSPGSADAAHDKMQSIAEEAMRQRRMKRFAEGGVISPTDPQPQPSTWQRLWSAVMGKEALSKAAQSDIPRTSTPPQNQDISIVRRAAEDAGKRMEAEKAEKEASKSKYGGYGK